MSSGLVQLREGRVLKDAGRVSTGEDCCCGVPCEVVCQSGVASAQYQVDVSGVVDNYYCDCEMWNGTFVLEGSLCHYEYHFGFGQYGQICTLPGIYNYNWAYIFLDLVDVGGGQYRLRVSFRYTAGFEAKEFRADFESPMPCTAWSAFPLIFVPPFDGNKRCDFTGATVLVTSL